MAPFPLGNGAVAGQEGLHYMYQKIFSDSLKKLQESNQKWWDDFEQGHSAISSPLTKAMHEQSIEDSSKFLESIANQPASILAIQMD
ncbi:MAG: hypothetical protein ACRC1U_06285, partial [Vibrionaceae bacterium]